MTGISIDYFNSGTNTIRSTIIDLTKSSDANYYNDFFVEDVKGYIIHNNLDIKELIYVLAFDTNNAESFNELKDIYIDLLNNFIKDNKDKFIMVRIGYDDSEKDTSLLNFAKSLFIEKYVALNEVGFVNVDSLTGLEFSQTFIYRNDASKKFLETLFRNEAMNFIGVDE